MQQCMIHGSFFIEIERIHALAPISEIKIYTGSLKLYIIYQNAETENDRYELNGAVSMARRKGLKQWDKISTEGWMTLLGDNAVMSQLMMRIFSKLYYTPDYTDNAKNIAEALYMEYRALNAGVGWAGNKIKSLYEEGKLAKNSEADGAEETGSEDAAGEGA